MRVGHRQYSGKPARLAGDEKIAMDGSQHARHLLMRNLTLCVDLRRDGLRRVVCAREEDHAPLSRGLDESALFTKKKVSAPDTKKELADPTCSK
jgi:hypothetical protein